MSGPPLAAGRAERRLAAGCVAGMAIAAAGSWVRFALERTPRIDTHTVPFLVASAVAGAGILVTGVCSLRLAPRAGRLSWRTLLGFAIGVQLAAFGALALTSSDVFVNLSLGALAHAGMSPYAHSSAELTGSPLTALVASRWVHDPSPYGPLFHPVARVAAWVGDVAGAPLWGAFWSFKALLVTAVAAALAIAAQHLKAAARPQAKETFALLALGPLLAWEVAAQGHNDGLLFLSLVAFLAAAAGGRDLLAAVALAAGVAVKYALAPLLGLYLLVLARRSLPRAVGVGLLASLVIGAAFAPEWRSVTLRAVAPMVGGEAARHAHSLTDLVCLVLDGLALPAASALAYRVLSLASALFCAGLLLRVALRARTLEELGRGYLLFLFGLYLTAPWFQPWYLCWALPFLLVEPDPRWRRLVAVFAVVTVAQWAAPLDPVTTVLGDLWAASRLWKLLRPAAAPTPPVLSCLLPREPIR